MGSSDARMSCGLHMAHVSGKTVKLSPDTRGVNSLGLFRLCKDLYITA